MGSWRYWVTALTALGVLAGCSSSASETGSVEGRLRMVGGPSPGTGAVVPGVVTATFSDGERVPVQVGQDGRYQIDGATGHVTLRGRSPNFNGGRSPCFGRADVIVKASSTVTADVLCPMR